MLELALMIRATRQRNDGAVNIERKSSLVNSSTERKPPIVSFLEVEGNIVNERCWGGKRMSLKQIEASIAEAG